jgi:outer membrane protein OmpA-like peptidoglycan-associated protein
MVLNLEVSMRHFTQIGGSMALVALAVFSTPTTSLAQTGESDGELFAPSELFALRIGELLRNRGYSQVELVNLDGASLSAKGCIDNALYDLTLNREGRVTERQEAGDCPPEPSREPVSDTMIIDTLYGRGYIRVSIVDNTPPTLLVNACRGDEAFQVRMDSAGDVIDTKPDGQCDLSKMTPLTADETVRILSLQGYQNIRVRNGDKTPYTMTACSGPRQFELSVTNAANITAREASGFCDVGTEEVEFLPPRPVEGTILAGDDALEPESCQMVFDWLQYEQPVTFAKESSELTDENLGLIATLAKTAKRCPMTEILVEGHTSTSGDDAFNQTLSEQRALAVQNAIGDAGISATRLKAHGFGEAYPRFTGDANADLNRRIEIHLDWDLTRS